MAKKARRVRVATSSRELQRIDVARAARRGEQVAFEVTCQPQAGPSVTMLEIQNDAIIIRDDEAGDSIKPETSRRSVT